MSPLLIVTKCASIRVSPPGRVSAAFLSLILLGALRAPASPPEKLTVTKSLVADVALSLDDCRRLALTHNLVLRAQRESLAAAGYLHKAELGAFEPEYVVSVSREYNQRLNTVEQTISQGTTVFEEQNNLYSAGVEGLLPSGARYNVGYSVRDLRNNLRVLPTDPLLQQYQSFVGVTLTQPLLKDAGFSATLAHLRLAREDEQIARQEFRRQMLVVVGSVESAYWDLYVAQERLKLRQTSVDAASKLLTENRDRVREGKMADIELIETQAGLAQRRSASSDAEQHMIDASGRLRTLFAEPVDQDHWILRASDVPAQPGAPASIDEAISAAINLHPEYLSRLHHAEEEKVHLSYAKNQRWPQIDLKASYGYNGLGDDFDGSYSDTEHRQHVSWSVGVEMRVPVLLGIRQRNDVRAARAHQREALLNLKAAEVEISNNIYTAERKVESLKAIAENYKEVADAGQHLLETEQGRLGEGKTDSRRLLEVENQYADAEVSALESRGEYEKARVEFEMASGRLLQVRGVDLAPEGPKSKRVTHKTAASDDAVTQSARVADAR